VELLTEEMWNARMPPALRAGAIDIAVSLCPEIADTLAYQTIRREPVVALVDERHPLSGSDAIGLGALADEEFLLFPRQLAPRLYDFLRNLCRRAGFEPRIRSESFHSGWELQILSDLPVVALVPASVAIALPPRISAVTIAEPAEPLETALVWRSDDDAPAGAALCAVAAGLFPSASRDPGAAPSA
jgi:DNA-binding transcriptional LysR family regulator